MKISFFKKKSGSKINKMIDVKNGFLEKEEREMIKGVYGLGETTVKEIMIPRMDVIAISTDESFKDIVTIVIKSGHSRIPIYEDTIDNVIGFLHAKDLLPYLSKETDSIDIKKLLRPVLFVPEGKMIDDLLREFKQKKVHIAVVVDEYGGMAGIACLENILEEIVGKIQDEYDNEEEEIKKLSQDTFICDARVSISELNETIKLGIPEDISDSFGGFVFNLLGKIPTTGEKITYDKIEFEIEKMDGHKIKKIRVTLKNHEKKDKNE